MVWQHTPYTIPLLAVSVVSLFLGVCIWLHYRSPLGKTGAVTILASTEWITTSALMLASSDLPTKIMWKKLQYPGVVVLPVAWFIFAVLYTGREQWLSRRVLTGLLVIPAVTLGLTFTNEYHGLIWSETTLDSAGSYTVLHETYGLGLQIFIVYAYALLLVGTFLFLMHIITCSRSRYRLQTSFLLVGAMVPWTATAIETLGWNPLPIFSLRLIGLALANVIVAFNIFYFRLGDVVPLAREAIIEGMKDSVIVVDTENRIVDMNPSAQKFMLVPQKATGALLDDVWPEWSSLHPEKLEKDDEIVVDHAGRIYDVEISPLIDWRDRIVSRVIVLRDVTDRKQSMKIKQSLQEKEVLLQEIHHRVKNNIQVISSLLKLQSYHVQDNRYEEMLRECQNRIQSMALIHEKLYQSKNLANIYFSEYIKDLVHSLYRSYGIDANEIVLEVEGTISFDINTAIPCGLIINELVSNSLKHAFPDGKGKIEITAHLIGDKIEITVSDNGVGMPEEIDFRASKSLGLHLVTILVEGQLHGTITLDKTKGTTFHITFRKPG